MNMRQTINGVLCDTATATLIAEAESGQREIGGSGWNCKYLYRTILGHFFVLSEINFGLDITLLKREEAMDLFLSLPDQKLDFDEAFEYSN